MSLFEEALAFALQKHAGALRKLDDTPYILHPVEVALIVSTMTSDETVLAAAVLHDTVEDTDATIGEIEQRFGARVASLVASETENKRPGAANSETWRIRKEESLNELARADRDVKLIWLGDKLSNLRAINRSRLKMGDAVFSHFNQKDPAAHRWYYSSIRTLLSELDGYDAWKEYSALLDTIFGAAV